VAKFVVEFEYSVDREGRQELHPAHAANLYDLAERGILLLGGPLADANAGLLVYEVEGREQLDRLLAEEPYVKGGIVARTRVREWSPGKGSWIEALKRLEQQAA
jgi:uncharacterized protein YciI